MLPRHRPMCLLTRMLACEFFRPVNQGHMQVHLHQEGPSWAVSCGRLWAVDEQAGTVCSSSRQTPEPGWGHPSMGLRS